MVKKNIYIFPGSFKPPHIGHLINILRIIKNKNCEKIYIIISKKFRPLNNEYYNLNNKPSEYIKDLAKKLNIEYTTKINTIKNINNNLIKNNMVITQNDSYKIWKFYLKYLPNNLKEKIIIIKSKDNSPIITTAKLIKKNNKNNNNYILLKSNKNSLNKRFDFIKSNNIKKKIINEYKKLSSSNFRNLLLKKKYDKINKFLPKNIEKNDFLNLIKIYKK